MSIPDMYISNCRITACVQQNSGHFAALSRRHTHLTDRLASHFVLKRKSVFELHMANTNLCMRNSISNNDVTLTRFCCTHALKSPIYNQNLLLHIKCLSECANASKHLRQQVRHTAYTPPANSLTALSQGDFAAGFFMQ